MDQLKAAEAAAEEAKQKMGLKIMGYVGKRWKNADVARSLTSWKVTMAMCAEEDKAARARAAAFEVEMAGIQRNKERGHRLLQGCMTRMQHRELAAAIDSMKAGLA
jgi:hypothetical protein